MSEHPPLLGLGAVVAGDDGSPELYRRQRHALTAAAAAVQRVDGDAAIIVAKAAVSAYLESMRESGRGSQ